jgi:hypothetical protein
MTEPLKIIDVFDRGVGGSERISVKVQDYCDLGHYWMGLGIRHSKDQIFPLNDNLLWMGRGYLAPGDWIFVYTGWGEPRTLDIPNSTNKIYTFFWKRKEMLFKSPEIFPYMINAPFVGLPESMEVKQTPALPNIFD